MDDVAGSVDQEMDQETQKILMAEWAKESLEMQMELIENFQKLANRFNNM